MCRVVSDTDFCIYPNQSYPTVCLTDFAKGQDCTKITTPTSSRPSTTSDTDNSQKNDDTSTASPIVLIVVVTASAAAVFSAIIITVLIRWGKHRKLFNRKRFGRKHQSDTVPSLLLLPETSESIASQSQCSLYSTMKYDANHSMSASMPPIFADVEKTYTDETIVGFGGPNFDLPGHLLLDAENVRILDDLAEGGGACIKVAEILSKSFDIHDNRGDKTVILKVLKG